MKTVDGRNVDYPEYLGRLFPENNEMTPLNSLKCNLFCEALSTTHKTIPIHLHLVVG